MSSLKKQAINGVLWTTIQTVVTFLTGPLLMIFQARYLTPFEFGILSVIHIFLSIINVIENFGFSTAIIQRDHVTKNERSSLFFFQIIFTSLVGIIVVLIAPIVAQIFDMEPLSRLLPLLSIMVFLNGPAILFTAFLEKDFYFKELSLINITRQISIFLFTVIFLVVGMGLTGVVLGQIISVAIMVFLILYVSHQKDYLHLKFHFNIKEIIPFIKYGLSIGAKQLMTQLTHHADELIIGYFLSAEILGLYYFAKNLLNRIRSLVSTAFSKVLLPLLSRVKTDTVRLTRTYNDISKYISVFAFPLFIGIALTADLFIPILFGDEWVPSVDFFVILSIAYIPYMLTANVATSLLYSINKPNLVLYTEIIANAIYIVSLLVISILNLGIYFVVGLYALYLILKTLTLQYLTQLHLHSTFKEYLLLLKPALLSTGIMAILVLLSKLIINLNNPLIELTIIIAIGVLGYTLIYLLLDRRTIKDILNLVKSR